MGSSPLYSRPYWAATHFVGDVLFSCPALRAARHYGTNGGARGVARGGARGGNGSGGVALEETNDRSGAAPTYFYFFDHVPRNPPFDAGATGFNGSSGVSHAFEMQFVWQGLPPALWAPGGSLIGADERRLSRTVAAYWTNFARSGNPNAGVRTPLTVEWHPVGAGGSPAYDAGASHHVDAAGGVVALQIALPALTPVVGRYEQQCAFIDSLGALPYPKRAGR